MKEEATYVKLVEKVVEINRTEGLSGQEINVLMLDKINKHQEVIAEMVRLQRIEIERRIPAYFILPGQGREEYMLHLSEPRQQLGIISKDQAAVLNTYEKQGYKKLYPDQYHLLTLLDTIANSFNKIWEQRYEDAMSDLTGNIDMLPMKASDLPNQKAKLFESQYLTKELRLLFISVIMTIGRLIRHIHYKISNETARFQDQSKAAELKYKKLEEYKDLLN